MEIIKERNSDQEFLPNWVRFSHQALYHFSGQYLHGKNVLDCACGTGIGSEIFLKYGASMLTGVDISPETIEIAKSRVKYSNSNFVEGDATKLSFGDSEFDVYVSIETIEHIEKDEDYLKEAYRLIKPGGIFICSTPNREVMNPGKNINDKPLNKFHVREYSKDEFHSLLKKKFKNVDIYGLNPNLNLKIKILSKLGEFLPGYGAVRINQIMKLPKLLFDKVENYSVSEMQQNYYYELLIAVCKK